MKQPDAAILTISSGLGSVAMAVRPTCATRAAVDSYPQVLRYQLKATKVPVIEIVVRFVQTS